MGPETGVTVTHAVDAVAAGLTGMNVDSVALRKAHAPGPSCDVLRLLAPAGTARVTTAGMPTKAEAACTQQPSSSVSRTVGEATGREDARSGSAILERSRCVRAPA